MSKTLTSKNYYDKLAKKRKANKEIDNTHERLITDANERDDK